MYGRTILAYGQLSHCMLRDLESLYCEIYSMINDSDEYTWLTPTTHDAWVSMASLSASCTGSICRLQMSRFGLYINNVGSRVAV